MNADEARAVIIGILARIAPEADPSSLAPDASLPEELDLDSMDFLNFAGAILDQTGIDVPERDYPQLQTLAGGTRYLVEHSTGP